MQEGGVVSCPIIKVMNQAVKRNIERFPTDLMFQLTDEEWKNQRSQIVIFKNDTRKYKPYAFTEQGIAMLSGLLNSRIAVKTNLVTGTFAYLLTVALPCFFAVGDVTFLYRWMSHKVLPDSAGNNVIAYGFYRFHNEFYGISTRIRHLNDSFKCFNSIS